MSLVDLLNKTNVLNIVEDDWDKPRSCSYCNYPDNTPAKPHYVNGVHQTFTHESCIFRGKHAGLSEVDPFRAPCPDDPRHPAEAWAALSTQQQAVELVKFQKLVVKRLLNTFEENVNPIGWTFEWQYGVSEKSAIAQLEKTDPARFDVIMGIVQLSVAASDLRGRTSFDAGLDVFDPATWPAHTSEKPGASYWYKPVFSGYAKPTYNPAGTGSSYTDEIKDTLKFFGDVHDAANLDLSDAKLKVLVDRSLTLSSFDDWDEGGAKLAAPRRNSILDELLGEDADECSVFGEWQSDFDGTMAKWMARARKWRSKRDEEEKLGGGKQGLSLNDAMLNIVAGMNAVIQSKAKGTPEAKKATPAKK
jgi:hypothetical protein